MKIYATSSITLGLRSVFFFVIAAVCIAPVLAQTNESQGGSKIASVTAISPKGWQTIVIKGAHFGTNPPINGCPDHMRVTDVTTNWSVPAVGPFGGCQAGIFVSSWNDNEIVIEGFPSFQKGQDAFKTGDVIKIEVSNAQQGGPSSWYSVRVSPEAARVPASTTAAPVSTQSSEPAAPGTAQIASVSPISPKGWQTIVIKGSNFGRNPPINGCPDHMRVTDVTTNWSVPAVGPFGGCQAGIFVSSWNDSEIVIEGFPSFQKGQDAFKTGDVIKIEVSNAQQGGPASWYSLRVAPHAMRAPATPAAAPISSQSPQPLTLPAGTSIMVRMIDSVDSSKNKIGDPFHASLDSALAIGDTVVAPKGADVYGKLAQVKSAGKISGGAELTLEMTGIQINGNIVPVDTTDYDAVSKGRGKQSASRIGGGAVLGSIIGGIARGGKGAAIGAGAGAAAGTAVQLATHGQQIRIPSETLLEFKLQQPVTVAAGASVGPNEGAPPSVEVGSSPTSMASSSTGDMVSPSAEAGSDTHSNPGDAATVTAANQCISGDAVIKKGPGTIRIESGTGVFSELSPSNKVITVSPGSEVQGTVTMRVLNQGPAFAVAPLIQTPSWGEHRSSWKLITNLRPGESTITAQVKERPPLQPGTYSIFFTFALELSGANVASGTNWARHADVWNDGNDISELEVSRAQEAQQFGCTVARWLTTDGFELLYLPADDIRVYVGSNPTHDSAPEPMPSATGPSIVQAVIQQGATLLELPPGQMYLYGMTTGGALPSSAFTDGQYAQVVNAAGKLSAALAYGTNGRNKYSTQTAYHDIGGVSVAGSWERFAAYYGSNRQSSAHDASVSFEANEDSLVVVLGLASSQQFVSVEGIPKLHVDASRTGAGIVIAHAYVKPGNYTVIERSKALAAGQGPENMADLVGVFVFGGKQANPTHAGISEQLHTASIQGSGAKGNIRDVDFQNFDYTSNCLAENTPAEVVHTSNGRADNQDGDFLADRPVYGDFKGDGHELAAVALGCHPADISPNVVFSEVFIFEMSEGNPKVVAKLPPSLWKQERVTGLKVSGQLLAVDFLEIGDKGSNACPEWVVTSKFRWNGSSFVSTSQSRKKNSCAQ